jgi:hypothetical protein
LPCKKLSILGEPGLPPPRSPLPEEPPPFSCLPMFHNKVSFLTRSVSHTKLVNDFSCLMFQLSLPCPLRL